MTRAVARVEQKIIITGADNASDAIKKAQRALGGLQQQTRKNKAEIRDFGKDFAEAGDQAAGRAGKLSTALSSLGDFAGKSEGQFRQASEAAGAFDDVLTLLPGPAGLAAAAVAGLTTVTYLQVQAAKQAEERLRQAFSGQILADVSKLKSEFGLTAEAAVNLGNALIDSGKSAGDVRDELLAVVNNAEAVGDDGSEAVSKFASSLTKGVTEAQKLTNRLKTLGVVIKSANLGAAAQGTFLGDFAGAAGQAADKNLAGMADKLKQASQTLKDLQAGTRGPLANYNKHLGAVQKIQIALGTNERITGAHNKALADQNAAIDAARANVKKLQDQIRQADEQRTAVADTLADVAKQEAEIRKEEAETERQAAVAENARAARAKAQQARSKARAAAAARAREAAKQAAFGLRQQLAGARALLQYQRDDLATADLIARARLASAKGTQAQVAAEKELIDVATARQVLEIENSELDAEDKAARIEAVKAIARAELTAKIQAIHQASAAVRKANKEARAKERAEAHQELVAAAQPLFDATAALGRAAGNLGSTGLGQLAASLEVAAQGALDLKKNLDDTPKAAEAAAGAVGSIGAIAVDAENARTQKQLEAEKERQLATATTEAERARIVSDFEAKKAAAVEAAERRKAGILALMELAKAAAAFPNVAQTAAHITAAGLFGAVAGGIIGGGSGAAAGPAGGGFSQAAVPAAQQGQQAAGGGGVTIVNNFNQPLVTRQHIGKAVQGAIRSIGTTGHAKAKGV